MPRIVFFNADGKQADLQTILPFESIYALENRDYLHILLKHLVNLRQKELKTLITAFATFTLKKVKKSDIENNHRDFLSWILDPQDASRTFNDFLYNLDVGINGRDNAKFKKGEHLAELDKMVSLATWNKKGILDFLFLTTQVLLWINPMKNDEKDLLVAGFETAIETKPKKTTFKQMLRHIEINLIKEYLFRHSINPENYGIKLSNREKKVLANLKSD